MDFHLKPYTGFALGYETQLSPTLENELRVYPRGSMQRVRSISLIVATCCAGTGKKEAAAGRAPDLRGCASIVGRRGGSLFKGVLHSPAAPQPLRR